MRRDTELVLTRRFRVYIICICITNHELRVVFIPGFPFIFFQRGMMIRSLTARVIRIAATKKTVRHPAGISKPPTFLCIVEACSTEKVIICAYVVQNIMVVAHIGRSLTIIFTSSTLVSEHSFHGFGPEPYKSLSKSPSATIAAFSKKLQNQKILKTEKNSNHN